MAQIELWHRPDGYWLDGEIFHLQRRCKLELGDTLLLYTDGITERQTSRHSGGRRAGELFARTWIFRLVIDQKDPENIEGTH
jgi:serine phosphatase RsbU (regulator of sigma subunit)